MLPSTYLHGSKRKHGARSCTHACMHACSGFCGLRVTTDALSSGFIITRSCVRVYRHQCRLWPEGREGRAPQAPGPLGGRWRATESAGIPSLGNSRAAQRPSRPSGPHIPETALSGISGTDTFTRPWLDSKTVAPQACTHTVHYCRAGEHSRQLASNQDAR